MARRKNYGGNQAPMGQRNTRIGSNRNRGGHPWNDFEGNPRLGQRQGLFSPPPKDKGVTPLQPSDHSPLHPLFNQELINGRLRQGGLSFSLTGKNDFGFFPGKLQQLVTGQIVIDYRIRFFDTVSSPKGQEFRVSGACPNKVHDAGLL